jgi:transposase
VEHVGLLGYLSQAGFRGDLESRIRPGEGRLSREIAADLGINYESLRSWVRQAEADAGDRQDRLTTGERERLKQLERENREARKANEILKAASTFFAKELDGTPRR